MAVAFDAYTAIAQGTGNLTATHTPVGTPRGIRVDVIQNLGMTDEIVSVTYGLAVMTAVAGSPVVNTGEGGVVYSYFLGSGIPTGPQTVLVTVNLTGSNKFAGVTSVTGTADTTIQDIETLNSNNVTNPTVTLALAGNTCFCSVAGWSGQNAITSVTPFANWTSRDEQDMGNQVGLCYTYDTIGTTDVAAGWTQAGDDAALIAAAITESGGVQATFQSSDFTFSLS